MNNNLLPINSILNGKYKVLDLIGQGGFGITYLVEHIELHNKFAIKECFVKHWCTRDDKMVYAYDSDADRFNEYKIKFINEARTLAKLHHQNIVKIIDYFEENNTAYFAMEFIENNLKNFDSDDFTFLFKKGSKFKTLIQKIPNTKEPKNFISYGYQ